MTGSVVLMIAYGYKAQEHDDPLIKMVQGATDQAAEVVQPGAFLVDVFPFCEFFVFISATGVLAVAGEGAAVNGPGTVGDRRADHLLGFLSFSRNSALCPLMDAGCRLEA